MKRKIVMSAALFVTGLAIAGRLVITLNARSNGRSRLRTRLATRCRLSPEW